MITRVKTFLQTIRLGLGSAGTYSQLVDPEQPTLDQEINTWLTEMEVKVVSVSPPTLTVSGRDANQHLVVLMGVSLLYQSEDQVDERPAADSKFTSGGLEQLLQRVVDQLPPGVKLDNVVRVARPEDAARLGIDPAKLGIRKPSTIPQLSIVQPAAPGVAAKPADGSGGGVAPVEPAERGGRGAAEPADGQPGGSGAVAGGDHPAEPAG